jgi:hypothetical protein
VQAAQSRFAIKGKAENIRLRRGLGNLTLKVQIAHILSEILVELQISVFNGALAIGVARLLHLDLKR